MSTEQFVDVAFRIKAQRDALLALAYRALTRPDVKLIARYIEVVERWRIENGETTQASAAQRMRDALDADPLHGSSDFAWDVRQPEAEVSIVLCAFCGSSHQKVSCPVRQNGGSCMLQRFHVVTPGTSVFARREGK